MASTRKADDHSCEWRSEATELKAQLSATSNELADVREELAALKKKLFGKSSEKMPPMDREVRRGRKPDKAAQAKARLENEQKRLELQTEFVPAPVPDEAKRCPRCADGGRFDEVGDGKHTSILEYVPGYFRRRVFQRQTVACKCGKHIVTAPVPDKVFDRTQYGPTFISWLVVTKCCDATPIYRLEKMFLRMGIPMSRSTMTRLFNRAGELVAVLASAILDRIAKARLVLADETPQRLQNGSKGYMWTFIAGPLVAYQFSITRSGDTPKRVLGDSTGTLLVDQYTGYNAVTTPGRRERAGCLAHVRRKLFDALPTAPEAAEALELIRQIYVIEAQVKGAELVGTPDHAEQREREVLPLLDRLYIWLAQRKEQYRPKSTMGKAIRYAMRHWQSLTRFIRDPFIPPDNNRSENALRIVALLRKTSMFANDPDTADNLAALLTIVATCVAHEVDPLAYLSDILLKVGNLPRDPAPEAIAALLPDAWTAPAKVTPRAPP